MTIESCLNYRQVLEYPQDMKTLEPKYTVRSGNLECLGAADLPESHLRTSYFIERAVRLARQSMN